MLLVILSVALAITSSVVSSTCPTVASEGTPKGQVKNIGGVQIYHTYPAPGFQNSGKAILFVSDIFGLPLLQNRLLADSLSTATNLPVLLPDLFNGDAIPSDIPESQLNLTDWISRHQPSNIEPIISTSISYMRMTLNTTRVGAVGYCFGGRYVPRFLASGKGLDVGFIAHPSGLETGVVQAIAGPISMAAGQLDSAFNVTLRRMAEDVLGIKNATFQLSVYSGAPHGFGVRVDETIPQQAYAKQASFLQAVEWLEKWL